MAVLAGLCTAFRQEAPSAAELKKMYDDAIAQLRSAQDRKNALAIENDKLQKQLAEVQKRCAPLEARNAELERAASEYAERTYQMRATQAAWKEYLRLHSDLRVGWESYLSGGGTLFGGQELNLAISRDWPLTEERR